MDKLPPEVLLCILSHLDREHLAQYTTVCRGFQFWIETQTFAKINKRIDDVQQLEEFGTIFASTRRCYLPRHVQFSIWLPNTPKKHIKGHEPLHVLRARHFTKVVCGIFEILQKWNIARSLNAKRPFHLCIQGVPGNRVSSQNAGGHHNNVGFYGFQVLPSLPFITGLRVDTINILPSTMSMIFEALPHIEDFHWAIDTPRRSLKHLRVSLRESLATTLLETNFSHLVYLRIALIDWNQLDGNWETENCVGLDGKDRLSLAVNRIMKLPNLKKLELHGVFNLSPAIFRLDDEHGNISESLRDIHLSLSIVTPDGRWYFNCDRGANTVVDEWDLSPRYCLTPTTFDPFVVAMARGVTKMPALKKLYCSFHDAAYLAWFAASAQARACKKYQVGLISISQGPGYSPRNLLGS
ncbi:uncharacterized protein F4807DRAFT_405884 [Annulohypoxylon truncatum]|uniref:uncharacterized protein n=1 Tax=Annulohypoxylon truncatum TaxID=327061 RepID=UPI0020089207|nr:uncharacterized protein F4807DRAFT_405884 [Annulohypoxylon truncatum]KAI1215099.1 hypothetical protein F4807DRAFT_405884 [Annulohypoxylon truncatum]